MIGIKKYILETIESPIVARYSYWDEIPKDMTDAESKSYKQNITLHLSKDDLDSLNAKLSKDGFQTLSYKKNFISLDEFHSICAIYGWESNHKIDKSIKTTIDIYLPIGDKDSHGLQPVGRKSKHRDIFYKYKTNTDA